MLKNDKESDSESSKEEDLKKKKHDSKKNSSKDDNSSNMSPSLKPSWDFEEIPKYNKTLPEIIKLLSAASNVTS